MSAPYQKHSETSKAAAAAIERKIGPSHEKIMEFLRGQMNGATDEEMINSLQMNPSTLRPRRIELVEMNYVTDSGKKRAVKSGNLAVVWCTQPLQKIPKKLDFMTQVFGYVESITVSKQDIMITEEDEKFYARARFMIHRALSFHSDLVQTVNLINAAHQAMTPRMEYEFFLNFVPPKVRRSKWSKRSSQSLFMESVREYYGYNETKAEEAMKLLTVEQLTMIDKKIKREDEWIFSEGLG